MTRRELVLEAIQGHRPNARGWARASCPVCPTAVGSPDRRGALSVNLESGRWHCFRCGSGGRLKDTPEQEAKAPPPPPKFSPPEGFVLLAGCTALSMAPAREHLLRRGIAAAVWEAAGIGACLSGAHYGRIIVPILAGDGSTWNGYVMRSWVKKAQVPYLYPPEMPRGELLYNVGVLAQQRDTPVMVVEGVMDALALWPDAVALLGKPSPAQVDMLAAAQCPIAVVLDGDAHREGWALAQKLRLMGQRAGSVRLPAGQDPDEVPLGWLKDEAARAVTL